MTRGRVLPALAVSLVVGLGGTLAAAALIPGSGSPLAPAAAAQPPPLPLPTADPASCAPGSPSLPACPPPTSTTALPRTGSPSSSTARPPCIGEGCIPQPGTTTAPPGTPGSGRPGQGEQPQDECGITDIGACVTEAVDDFFRDLVVEALNPLLDLLSRTLLTTPMPESLPRVGELWENSWQILVASYSLLVLIAGVVAMGYQTVQTRQSIKEITPRLVVGFLAGTLSMWVATKAIQIANAAVAAIMDGGVDAATAAAELRNMVVGSAQQGGVFTLLLGIALAGMLVALLMTYVVRVALTIILIVGAPPALMFHALEQTEGIAYWWWKATGGCLAVQIGQSLTLITAFKVLLAPGGFTPLGPTTDGLVNLLVTLALMYILVKIPFWVLSAVRGTGGRRGLVGSLVRAVVAYKTFTLLGGRGRGRSPGTRPTDSGRGSTSTSGTGPPDPYAGARTTTGGQYVLPLPGVRRTRPAGSPTPTPKPGPAPKPSAARRRQLVLPLGQEWPENKPILGRDGQYRLPLDVQRTTPPPASPTDTGTDTGTGARRPGRKGNGGQLELPFDPYRGNRPTRSGQYPLPLDAVRRVPRPAEPPSPPVPRPSGRRVLQPELPFDPYTGNRPTRGGQYRLPLEGVRRVPAPKPAPGPPPAPPRRVPRTGRQLRLPLDLPKPTRPSTPPQPAPPPPPAVPPKPTPGGKSS